MSISDPISDMLTRIRNAMERRHESVVIPHSNHKCEMIALLKTEGFISDYSVNWEGQRGSIQVQLKYGPDRRAVIRGIERVSKPSKRHYVRKDDIPYVRNGLGIAIITTSKGVLTDRDARNEGVGGEVVCYVW